MKAAALFLLPALAGIAAPRPERFAIILEDPPVAAQAISRKDLAHSAKRDQLAARQQILRDTVTSRGMRVTTADQVLVNAIFAEGPADAAASLRSLPGVAYVEKLPRLKPHLGAAVNLMNVPGAWSAVNGPQNAGSGVKIAILDTGIDQNHPAFQDKSVPFPAGFPKCQQSRGDCSYVNNRVIAARSYVNLLVGTNPQSSRPDDLSPRDRSGHGTAVAMIAGGAQTTGPGGSITGVAPKAWLGNYKILGSPGVNGGYTYDDVVIRALNDAIADGMDIAVLSLGVPAVWGPRDPTSICNQGCDWRSKAVENAVSLGLTVVVSAGNDGDIANHYPAFGSVNTPGTAPTAITVGASTNSHAFYQSVRLSGPDVPADLQRINTKFGDGPPPDSALSAPVRDVTTLGDDGHACSPLASNSLTGTIALIQRGNCEFPLKVLNAQRAGAVGAIIYRTENSNVVFPMVGLEETGIPAALIGNRDGTALKNYAAQHPDARVSFDPGLVSASADPDRVAYFSSRGPSIRENAIKPELLAVGTDLYTATQSYDLNGPLYSASGYTSVQGTSFAAGLVAGALAIVKQRNSRMTPAQLKSAVVNTANPNITDFDENDRIITAGVLDMGAGKLDAEAAARTTITVEPATLSFGVLGNNLPGPKRLTVCNFGTGTANLQLGASAVTGTVPTLSTSRVAVNAGSCNTDVTVGLSGSRPRPGVYEGAVTITGGAVPLRVPYLYLVGDGVPFSVFPLEGDGFEADMGAPLTLTFKVIDQYGVPVQGANVAFQTVTGDGVINQQLTSTDDLGISFADITLGRQIGQQEFYAAVGNNRNLGLYFSGRARSAPAVAGNGVVDSASQQGGRGFAPGSYISVYGRSLSDATRVYSTTYLPLALAGVSVSFDVPSQGLSVPGRLRFVSDGQIDLQIPWELQGVTSTQMKVSIGDSSSTLVTVPIASQSPSLFEYRDTGGQMFAAAVGEGGVLGSGKAARKGSIISLYANGLGAVDNQPASGEPARTDALSPAKTVPTVTVGGRPAEVLFAGLAPGYVGLYQINVRVPSDAPSGSQPVIISSNGIASKSASVPIE